MGADSKTDLQMGIWESITPYVRKDTTPRSYWPPRCSESPPVTWAAPTTYEPIPSSGPSGEEQGFYLVTTSAKRSNEDARRLLANRGDALIVWVFIKRSILIANRNF